jgi:hypothetical protein
MAITRTVQEEAMKLGIENLTSKQIMVFFYDLVTSQGHTFRECDHELCRDGAWPDGDNCEECNGLCVVMERGT